MPETTAEKIQRLAVRRQALWAKAPALTLGERAELIKLTSDLDLLWEQHRSEMARTQLVPPRRPSPNGAAAPRKRSVA
jgi:hypothetical protein